MDNRQARNWRARNRRAKNRARGPKGASINKLPPEILVNIMRIVSYTSRRKPWGRFIKGRAMRYPDVLSHVCAYWREVAIRSPDLWSHVYMPICWPPKGRSTTFLERIGQSPLGLHLSVDDECRGDKRLTFDHSPFPTPAPSRLSFLELNASSDSLLENHRSAIFTYLTTYMTANLTELVLRNTNHYGPKPAIFIKAAHNRHAETTSPMGYARQARVLIDLTEERLEDILLGIITLRLFHIYPGWRSNAYRGLVELRLVSGDKASIPEGQLVGIIRSSPKLRILHIDIRIRNIAPPYTVIDTVDLHDLEVLNLNWLESEGIDMFFRWLAPCSKLFQFSLCCSVYHNNDMHFGSPAIVSFLTGSSISMLNVNGLSTQETVNLLKCCPHIHTLAYQYMQEGREATLPIQFSNLYLINCKFDVDRLRRLIQSSSVKRLVVCSSKISRGNTRISHKRIPAALSDVCSDVLMWPYGIPDPVTEWEAFWS